MGSFSLEVGDTATSAFFVGIDVAIQLTAGIATDIEAMVATTFWHNQRRLLDKPLQAYENGSFSYIFPSSPASEVV